MKKLEEYKKDILWKEFPNKIHIRADLLVSKRVIDILGNIKNKKIVDLGCGNGKVSRWMADKGAKVIGVDLLKKQIDLAKESDIKGKYDIKYIVENISDKDFNISEKDFDIAVSLMTHLYLNKNDFIQSLKNAYKIIKKGGKFIYGNIHPCRVLLSEQQKGSVLETSKDGINYFEISKLTSTLISSTNTNTSTTSYLNHPMEFVFNSIIEAGFTIKKVYEPKATENELKTYSSLLSNENKVPSYLIIECIKS